MEEYKFGVIVEALPWQDDMPEPQGNIDVCVTFDGKVFDYHTVSLPDLIRSAIYPGEYEILTCTCGHGRCAGIYDGIVVLHSAWDGDVRWLVPHPISQRSSNFSANVTMYRTIALGDLADYRATILSAADAALKLFSNPPFPLEFSPRTDVRFIQRLREALADPPLPVRLSYYDLLPETLQ